MPDVHVPYHNKAWWRCTQKLINDVRPDTIVTIGDFLDCYAVSFHAKDPSRTLNLKDELDEGAEMMSWLRSRCKHLWTLGGNHELRLDRYIAEKAPALAATHPSIAKSLGVEKNWVPYRKSLKLGVVSYTHDLGHAGSGALPATLNAFGHCIVFGHTHRAGVIYDGDVSGSRRFAMNVGWGGDIDSIDYMHVAKTKAWQLGLGMVTQTHDGLAWANFVPFVSGRMVVDGKTYRA